MTIIQGRPAVAAWLAVIDKRPGPQVYRLYAADQTLLYVGSTKRTLGIRLQGHRLHRKWWPEVVWVTTEALESLALALAAEAAAIQGEGPRHNSENRPPLRSPQLSAPTPSPEGFEESVERLVRSRLEQGLPLHLEDAGALERIAQLLLAAVPGLGKTA